MAANGEGQVAAGSRQVAANGEGQVAAGSWRLAANGEGQADSLQQAVGRELEQSVRRMVQTA